MDVSGITNLAAGMAAQRNGQEIGIAVMKKALDVESSMANALIQALPPVTSANLPSHLGQHVNTVA